MSVILKKQDLTEMAIRLGIWDSLCDMTDNPSAEEVEITEAKAIE